ncbi:molecular chaperone [Pseudomonas sp. 10B1]|uniref:fimbrial biogenesis chaperone n=1 Tax=unclassified Pseudomonas TaxID=196821 RepID=UPI002AB37730|nr:MULTISPECIES: molecular chaperone [unclassified Pseudomonas]MEB0217711.1 molecular chaperone [Pseudomonas sp. AB12(2023)]MDY7559169.1 molecular chaperone [Pseudomonas sp. AB6]MEA9978774.1 molecular chaperone [Pseudomonas sp. RTS4]MEA9994237.1 molecular chaperone [Pseudomonas sp. AA4]MEB0086128.1 molecular chaperone [Pseudomonas sp. RTI1]
MIRLGILGWLAVGLLLNVPGAQAAVSLSGTRLIFDGNFREVSIEVVNRSNHEVLLQAWLSDAEDIDADQSNDLPFAVTPHLSQLSANRKQALRLLYEGVGRPLQRESLLHLYVMEIPRRAAGENQLSIAIRQRINVFYRPPGLSGDPAQTAEALLWSVMRDEEGASFLRVSNPTAYHASLQHVQLDGANGKHLVSDYQLLPPGVTLSLPLGAVAPGNPGWHHLSFKALTDYGGPRYYSAEVEERLPFNARLRPTAAFIKDVQP